MAGCFSRHLLATVPLVQLSVVDANYVFTSYRVSLSRIKNHSAEI